MGSFTGELENGGICFGGTCLDILNPLFNVVSGPANASGVASFSFNVPAGAPTITVWGQAVVLRTGPVMVESNVQSKTIQ